MRNKKNRDKKRKRDRLTPDKVFVDYWRRPQEFADFFNTYLFGGKEILKAEQLVEMDTNSSTVLTIDDSDISVQAARDMVKAAMSCNGVRYAILGLENQNYIHYAIPLVVGCYDLYSYDRQYKLKKAHYKKTNELRGNERMSSFKKTDRLTPVITVVIYYGKEPWDGPLSMYDMIDIPDELKPFAINFNINLLEVRNNSLVFHNQNNIDLFSLLGIILDDSLNGKAKREKIVQYEAERTVDKSVRMAIAATSKLSMNRFEKEDDVNVVSIWDDAVEEGKIEGRAEEIVSMGLEMGWMKDAILDRLHNKLGIDKSKAEEYYKTYSEKSPVL